MRLLDQVAQTKSSVRTSQDNGDTVELPGANALAAEIARCPLRYVLDDDVTAMCAEIAFDRDALLPTCCDILRAPASAVWMEFNQLARYGVMRGLGFAPEEAPPHQRIGVFLKSGERPKAGRIYVLWENEDGMAPDLCPVFVDFDLDDPCYGAGGLSIGEGGPAIAGLEPLVRHLRFAVDPEWAAYYAEYAPTPQASRERILVSLTAVLGDAPMLFSLMLLAMSGKALQSRHVEFSRLNAVRAKNGKAPLLEHLELRLDLPLAANDFSSDSEIDAKRDAPRLHLVRGHLVRREDRVFWRSSHLRGDPAKGEVKTRTFKVRLGRR